MNRQVVLITGALTGIGRAAAIAFAQDAAQLVVSGRRDKKGQGLVAELTGLGAEAIFVHTDVRNEHDVRDLVDKAVARFGHLDVAVNCAGTEGRPGPMTEQTAETYAATFDTNVLGTLLSMKHELHVMLAQRRGSIVNVRLHTVILALPVRPSTKRASMQLKDLTKSAALEAAESGVRVNMVSPGPVETGMLNRFTGTAERKASLAATVLLNRVGTPEEIAKTITFLASDKASFITGASYLVDGGKSARYR